MDRKTRPPELDWLLAVGSSWLTGGEPPSAPPDAASEALTRSAFFHHLEPFLGKLVLDHRDWAVPRRARAHWESAYYENLAYNTTLFDLLARLAGKASHRELAIVALKGPAWVARTGSDPGIRVHQDLDILCRATELVDVSALAIDSGFEAVAHDAAYHLHFRHPERLVELEIHFDLYSFLPRRQVLLDRLLETRQEVDLDGRPVPALALEEDLLFHVAHLVHHDLELNLRPYLDLATLLLRQRANLDPERLAWTATRFDLGAEARRILEAALSLFGLEERFDELIPLPRGGTSGDTAAPDRIAGKIEAVLSQPGTYPGGALGETLARPGWLARFGGARRLVLPPLTELQALYGERSRLAAAARWPRHAFAVLARGWNKWRRAGLAEEGAGERAYSLKREVFRRRRRDP